MEKTGNVHSLVSMLKECSCSKDLRRGKQVHSDAIQCGLLCNIYVANSLINMYGKCGNMAEAQKVFDKVVHANVVTWTSLIMGYVHNGESELALQLFDEMGSRCSPNSRTYVVALTACANLATKDDQPQCSKWLEKGKKIHCKASTEECCDCFVNNASVDMYARCGSLKLARTVFDSMLRRDVVSWNILLQGYAENGDEEVALNLFHTMEEECVPDARSLVVVITACAALADKTSDEERRDWVLRRGRVVHCQAVLRSCFDVFIGSALVDMYAKCGTMLVSRNVFDSMVEHDVVSWNALLHGYARNEQYDMVLQLFTDMQISSRHEPNARSYVAALTACAGLASHDKGKVIHFCALLSGHSSNMYVGSTLIHMYAKCGNMLHSHLLLDTMTRPNSVSWNALLQGYIDNGKCEMAVQLFEQHAYEQRFDSRSYVAALTACATLRAHSTSSNGKNKWLRKAKAIHSCAKQNPIATCDVLVWNCMVREYVESGENELALELVREMQTFGCEANAGTFAAALMACGNLMALEQGSKFHAEICQTLLNHHHHNMDVQLANCLVDFYGKCGSMDAARQVFDCIQNKTVVSWNCLMSGYNLQGNTNTVFQVYQTMREQGMAPDEVTHVCLLTACSHGGLIDRGREIFDTINSPTMVHYNCMIDLLGRANHLEEAFKMISSMPYEPNAVTWRSLLSACTKWKNLALAERVYQCLVSLDRKDSAAYVLMGNIYKGSSSTVWTDECGKVHTFIV